MSLPSRSELGAAGFGLLATFVVAVVWIRGPVTPDSTPPPPASASSTAPFEAPPEASAEQPVTPRPLLSSGDPARIRLTEVRRDLDRGKWLDALAGLEALCKEDPRAAEEAEVWNAIVELATRITLLPGAEPDRYFDLLLNHTGTVGPDILYHLWTTKGGSEAAKRSERLLAREDVRARGTPALRVAWELRAARCTDKPALFSRAGTDGDGRTLGQLVLLGEECGRKNANCCFPKDPTLNEAMAGIRARL